MTQAARDPVPLYFADFVVDPSRRSIQRGTDTVVLTPKTWTVLYYLASRPGQVVSKDELFAVAWPDTVVSEGTLTWCVGEIRRALDDRGRPSRYLKTVHGQGYRFIAPVAASEERAGPHHEQAPFEMVGREAEGAQLQQLWQHVLDGQRQVGFVTGEAGIGKTTLVSAFVRSLSATQRVSVGQGQCVEQYGMGEAYHPVLAALNQLSQGTERDRLLQVLWEVAPSWLRHLPALLSLAERTTLAAQYQDVSQTQALRELADALEALAVHQPVVLILEDLHWSDTATLAFVSMLARQTTPARVLVLGTYRPVDVLIAEHPVREMKAELQLHDLCQEVALEYLTQDEVHAYVVPRLGEAGAPLAPELYTHNGGNPLFLVNLVDALQRGNGGNGTETVTSLRERWEALASEVPERVQELIVLQADRLGAPERAVVEVASVNGVTFSPTLVAAGLRQAADEVEAVCESLERQGHFIHAGAEVTWPDGTLETQYMFQHALQREALYQRMVSGRRRRLHRAMATRLEAGYGEQSTKVAAELALHFEQGREVEKAVEYYHRAGQVALQRSAEREAVVALRKGLALAETLPAGPSRLAHQLQLQMTFAPALMAVAGQTSGEAEDAFLRARELCEQAGNQQHLFFVLFHLFRLYHTRGDYRGAQTYAETCLRMATEQQDPLLLVGGHYAVGINMFYHGQLTEARTQTARGVAVYNPEEQHSHLAHYGFHHQIIIRSYHAGTLGMQGYPEQAERFIAQTLATAAEQRHVYSLVVAHAMSAVALQFWRRGHAVLTHAEAAQ